MPYLLPTPHGYYFRLAISGDVRHLFRKRELKKSLKTAEKKVALGRAIQLAAGAFALFERLRDMTKFPYSPEMVIDCINRLPDGTITFGNIQTDPDKPQDTEDLIKLINGTAVTSGTPSPQTRSEVSPGNKQTFIMRLLPSKNNSRNEFICRFLKVTICPEQNQQPLLIILV